MKFISTHMRSVFFFLTFCAISPTLFSQIKGVLVDAKTREPLYGVRVDLSTGQRISTGGAGDFTISPSRYPVKIKFSLLGYLADSLTITKDTLFTMTLFSQVQEFNAVVVSAGRRTQQIEDVPISMEIIRPELINNKGLSNLEQAVDQSPGVYAMDGQVSIRGGGGYAYGAGSRVVLLWNGIPMLSPDLGDAKWNAIPMEQTSQIEIMKGASSVLYGSGALNGIIALTEKEPSPKGELKAKVQSGVYGNPRRSSMRWWDKNPTFHLIDLYYGKSFKNIGFTVGANTYLDSGYRQGENEKRYRINGSFYYKPQKFPRLKTGVSYNAQYQDVGVFVLWKNDSMGLQALDNTLSRQKAIRINFDPYVKFYDKYNNKHYFRTRYYLVTTGNSQTIQSASFAQMYYSDYQFQRKFSEHLVMTAGAMNNISQVRSAVFGNHQAQNMAGYAQFESHWEKWDFSGGMRLEYYQLDTLLPDSRSRIGDSLYLPVSPVFRAGAHYALTKASHFRVSVGEGVRFPSIAERFVSTSVGGLIIFKNPKLLPEKGWAGEIGYKQIVKIGDNWKGYVDVAGFINQYSNMTEFAFNIYNPLTGDVLNWIGSGVTTPEDSAIWNNLVANGVGFQQCIGFRATNAERARITGLELSFNSQGKIGEVELTSLIGYTYMNPISLNKDSAYRATFSDPSSNLLKYRFRHLAKADIQATYKSLSVGFSGRYNSYMQNIDAVFEQNIGSQNLLPGLKDYREKFNKGALVFDARVAYAFKEELKLNVIVNNILNAEYVSRPGDIQPPRNFIVQLQVGF